MLNLFFEDDEREFSAGGNQMGNVIELNRSRVFTVTEVEEILPVVRRITDEYFDRLQSLMSRLDGLRSREDQQSENLFRDVEQEINVNVEAWQNKLEKLGAHTKGLWIADFDSGDGYYCWKYPEEKVRYWHQYNDGFRGRILLENKIVNVTSKDSSHRPDLEA
jgi:hypothetical protein